VTRVAAVAAWVGAAVLLAAVLYRLPDTVRAMHSNADLAAPLAMAHLLADLPHSAAVTGNYGWWNGLWVVQLLRPLPGDTLLASYLPLAVTLLAVGALTLQARRLFGTTAAAAVPAVALAVGPTTWVMNAAWSGRAPSWWAMVAVGLVLVAHAGRSGTPASKRLWLATGAAVLWGGAALSGDALAWTSVVAPAAGVAAVALLRRRWRQAAVALGVAAGVAVASVALRALAEYQGYFQRPSPVSLTPFDEAQAGAGNVVVGLQEVWRGPLNSAAGAASGYLGLLLVVVAAAAGVVYLLGGTSRPGEPAADADADVEETPAGGSTAVDAASRDAARVAWATFWTGVAVAGAVAFAFSPASMVNGLPVARYLYGVPFAAGALIALLAGRRGRPALVLVPTLLLALVAALGIARQAPPRTPEARVATLDPILAVARQERVTRGYASYWTAYPTTVRSGFRLQIDPVGTCPASNGQLLCPMYLHYVDRAYEPRPGIRSFLLVDTSHPGGGDWVGQAPATPAPVARHTVAPGIEMLIYDHDLAADLVPVTSAGDALHHR
jgi:hypothetical protein